VKRITIHGILSYLLECSRVDAMAELDGEEAKMLYEHATFIVPRECYVDGWMAGNDSPAQPQRRRQGEAERHADKWLAERETCEACGEPHGPTRSLLTREEVVRLWEQYGGDERFLHQLDRRLEMEAL
jgi:hypothetical protein